VTGLSMALDDDELEVRRGAIEALRVQGAAAEAPLVRATTEWAHPELADLREAAVTALIAVGDEQTPRRCAAALLGRPAELTDGDGAVVRELSGAWGPGARRATIADLVGWLADPVHALRARHLLVALAPDSVEPLLDALADPATRVEAALALGETRNSRATEPLCHALLESDDPGTRAAAAWALGEVRDPAAVETLLIASGDDDFGARTAALDAFDKLGSAAVAVATSLLVRPGIENGAGTPPPIRQVEPPPAASRRAGPMLRRLLGRSDLG
jgi:HEAT repeat protein